MCLQAILGLLDSLVPHHGVIALNVLLSYQHIASHFNISTALLPRKHVSLAFHKCMLDPYKEKRLWKIWNLLRYFFLWMYALNLAWIFLAAYSLLYSRSFLYLILVTKPLI